LRYWTIGAIHELMLKAGLTSFTYVEGRPYTLIIPFASSPDDASRARRSASTFSSLGTWRNSTFSNFFNTLWTSVKYLFILSPLASYSPLTCPTNSCESLCMIRFFAPNFVASLSPVKRDSYSASASLLVVWK
jgi:hypothetical protein